MLQEKIWKQLILHSKQNSIVEQITELTTVYFIQYVQYLRKKESLFKRHKDTLSYFNKNYVQPEIFPRELGRKIVKAEEIRHASDYDTFYIASKMITAEQIETAEKILELAEKYLFTESESPSEDENTDKPEQ